MADVMLTLGSYQFGLNTAAFQELNRNTEWRWPSQDVFNSRPVLQFAGWGEDTITLPGVIFPEYWGGTGQVDALRELADSGEPQTLIDGLGNVLGEWAVTGVQERQSTFGPAGVGRRQEFTVTLKRYGGELLKILSPVAVVTTVAATATEQASNVATSAASNASKSISVLTAAGAAIQAIAGSTVTPVQGVLNAIGQAISAAKAVELVARDTQDTIAAFGKITNLSTAQSALGDIMRTASNAAQTAAQASRAIGVTIVTMKTVGDSVANISKVVDAQVQVNRVAVNSTAARSQSEDIVRGFE